VAGTRDDAIARMSRALDEYYIAGIRRQPVVLPAMMETRLRKAASTRIHDSSSSQRRAGSRSGPGDDHRPSGRHPRKVAEVEAPAAAQATSRWRATAGAAFPMTLVLVTARNPLDGSRMVKPAAFARV